MKISKIKQLKEKNVKAQAKVDSLINEIERVKGVLDDVDNVVSDLDHEFEERTGIINKTDMSFMFVVVMLQSLRWILMPELKLANIENNQLSVKKEDRLRANQSAQKGGIYDGKSSGSIYEQDKLKQYRNKKQAKYRDSRNEFENGESRYRTWIEILTQPVPYDAMYAMDDSFIPKIGGLNALKSNGYFSNLSGGNHHVATLGHDPVLGWIFGTANILSSTITMMNYQSFGVIRGHRIRALSEFSITNNLQFSDQRIDYSDPWLLFQIIKYCIESVIEDPKRLPAAVVRQAVHFESDKYCKEGLPIPLLSSINPQRAQNLIEKGWNSEELKVLMASDLKTIGISVVLSVLINLIVESIYLFCMDDKEDIDLRRVRVKKLILVANVIVSSSNILYVTVSKNIGKIDVGGIGVTLVTLFKSKQFIDRIKQEYIAAGLKREIMGDSWMEYVIEKGENYDR